MHEAGQQHGRVGVQLSGAADVDVEAPHVAGVAAVRAGAGDHGAQDQDGGGRDGKQIGEQDELAAGEADRRAGDLPGAGVEHRRVPQQQHRHQEVAGDQGGIEMEDHGQAAEHGLGDEAERPGRREQDGELAAPLLQAQRPMTTTAMNTPTPMLTSRLPNSTTPCRANCECATNEPSPHSGQVGQPSPLPVSRTAAPVTTIRPSSTIATRVSFV